MNPPREYTLQELADDVRLLINHLRQHGVIGLQAGVDFDAVVLLEDGEEINTDTLYLDEMEIEVPAHIVRMIRWYSGR
jgi:hypothetical protein